jgi:hypothetical protein
MLPPVFLPQPQPLPLLLLLLLTCGLLLPDGLLLHRLLQSWTRPGSTPVVCTRMLTESSVGCGML